MPFFHSSFINLQPKIVRCHFTIDGTQICLGKSRDWRASCRADATVNWILASHGCFRSECFAGVTTVESYSLWRQNLCCIRICRKYEPCFSSPWVYWPDVWLIWNHRLVLLFSPDFGTHLSMLCFMPDLNVRCLVEGETVKKKYNKKIFKDATNLFH